MMVENERSGGVSPKVLAFPSMGDIGAAMTNAKLKLSSIITKSFTIEVESMVDIITFLQIFGESGCLHGRRKGIYRDLLLAAAAYYDSEYSSVGDEHKLVSFSIEMGVFIGWK
jgi:hypothetical protein